MVYPNEHILPSDPLSSTKTSVKWLEVPIQKFNAAVPHFVDLLKDHHNNIKKLNRLNQYDDEAEREHTSASRTVKQLTSLLSEMDHLRDQVVDEDVGKFDRLISSAKQNALTAVKSHQALSIRYCRSRNKEEEDVNTAINDGQDQQLQSVAQLQQDMRSQEELAASMDRLQVDVQDINELFQDLSQLVHEQGESVEKIEEHVEKTHEQVVEGEKLLCQAAKYKNSMFPLMGALIGSVVGGPIGLMAGLKVGAGVTAMGCAILGFTGGKMVKDAANVTVNPARMLTE